MPTIVSDKNGVQIILLDNGKYQAKGNYRGLPWETKEADDEREARQFAYFVLNELSARALGNPIPEKVEA